MGRRSHSQTLSLWANGVRVGRWTLPARGLMELEYDSDWVASDVGRPISLSLPFTLENRPLAGEKVRNYFDNLLPDNDDIRKRIAERFRTGSSEPFDLLKAVGRDCVGALQLLGEDETPVNPRKVEGTAMSDEDIEQHLRELTAPRKFGAALDREDDFRVSIAGAQEKTALCRWGDRWLMPHGSTPTTHILKLPMGLVGGRKADFTTSVDNEWLCLRLLHAYGIPAANASIATFGSQRVLVVERFDRKLAANRKSLLRLPQEDFCQIEGVSPLSKYESHGGPGLVALSSTLRQSSNSGVDMMILMAAQILFWLMRAPDGHAKNFSVHLLPQGRFQLTPLYDVMSAYPVQGDGASQWSPREIKLAMALLGKNKHYAMHTILRRHFNSTAKKVGYAEDAESLIKELLERTPLAIEEVRAELPAGLNPRVADTILDGVAQAARALEAMPAH